MYQFRLLPWVLSGIVIGTPSSVIAADNAWTKPNSGNWEEQAYWSLGVLPDATQSVLFTNAGWKALAIGANTAQNFPQSMRIQSLQVEGPVDSFNTLLMNWSGFEQPLQTISLTVQSNASVAVHGSVLEVVRSSMDGSGNLFLGGTFIHADLSRVKVDGLLNIQRLGISSQPWIAEPGAYFLTNGILTVGGLENVGSMSGPGKFVQHGGSNNVGSLQVGPLGDFDLYGGQVTATNGLTVGYGDFGGDAHFFQHGGSVNADTDVTGVYVLNGGTITGRMEVPSTNSFDRADGRVGQNGGTNFAASLDMGLHAGRRGGYGTYVLSDGVLRVGSSVTIRGGTFSQSNGVHTIASNLFMRGDAVPGLSTASAWYLLQGGILSVDTLTAYGTYFQQTGGSNLIAGDVVFTAAPPEITQLYLSAHYRLEGGFFSARNVLLDTFLGGFSQTGGSSQIAEKLTVQAPAATNGSVGYTLEGGSLTVNTICLSNAGVFYHTGGVSRVTQLFVLPGADQRADYKLSTGKLNSARVYLGTPNRIGSQRGFFTQIGGVHSNSQSIIASGDLMAPEINYFSGTYELFGGLLSSPGIGLDGGMFSQAGGTNYTVQLSLTNGGSYYFAGGLLITSNTVVQNYLKPAAVPRFVHGSGAEHRVKGLSLDSGGTYQFAGGVLSADMISVRGGAELRLGGGVVSSNRTIEINGGRVIFEGNHSLGHLLFNGIAHFNFRGGSTPSVVHFSGVGYPPPALDGALWIDYWDGRYDGFYIDTADEYTRYRIQNITFIDPAGYPPGHYRAWRKADGEIVPLDQPRITFTRDANRMVLTWPEGYQLYTAETVVGPFQPVDAQSGWSATFSDPQRFFLLRRAQ
jgi:hypothetical protein